MGSFKALMNSMKDDPMLRTLTENEVQELRSVFLTAFSDLNKCCQKYKLSVMLIGGSVLGAVRHKGFIPWDDDMDVAMPRNDFEKLKKVFAKELGDKYILSSPNYQNNASARFPMMLLKDTVLVEAGASAEDSSSKIKIDIFIIENIPQNKLSRTIKGFWCTLLMAMGSYEQIYELRNSSLKQYMCKTPEGTKEFKKRVFLGRLFSFFSFQQWMNFIDSACQYHTKTGLMSIPTGRGHYFQEIRPAKTFLPISKGEFEGMEVSLPGDPHDYLRNLYGENYMTPPPVEKRERHFIIEIKFKDKDL